MKYQAQLQTVAADAGLKKILDILATDGGVIIKNPVSASLPQDLDNELGPVFDSSDFCGGNFYGNRTKRTYGLIAKSEACRRMTENPAVLDVMKAILGPHSNGKILLNLTQGIEIHPGQKEQALHRDDSMFGAHPKPHEFMMNTMWAQTDFTEENGATLIVPGSHLWPQNEEELFSRIMNLTPKDIAAASMKAGDVLIYLGSTVHGGGANVSTAPRRGVVMSYSVAWLRQAEPQHLAAPWEIASQFSDELQDLLGYNAVEPNLGLLEGMPPKEYLATKPKIAKVHDFLTSQQNELLSAYHSMKEDLAA